MTLVEKYEFEYAMLTGFANIGKGCAEARLVRLQEKMPRVSRGTKGREKRFAAQISEDAVENS